MLELKVVDLTFFILFYFPFYFILNLGLGFSMTLYTSHGHIIMYHTKKNKEDSRIIMSSHMLIACNMHSF